MGVTPRWSLEELKQPDTLQARGVRNDLYIERGLEDDVLLPWPEQVLYRRERLSEWDGLAFKDTVNGVKTA